MKKLTNHTIKVDKILALDFEKEYIIAGQSKKEAQEEAMKDYIEKKKAKRTKAS
jgi:hypothetical protein